MADKLEERRDYRRGQWDAFDRVLALLNGMTTDEPITQDQMRRRVYGEVMSLKAADPEAADEITRLNAESERAKAELEECRKALVDTQQRSRARGALVDELLEGLEDMVSAYTGDWLNCERAIEGARALITKASRDSGHETRT